MVNHLFESKAQAVDAAAAAERHGPRKALKKVYLTGRFTERDLTALKNASRFCPVGRMFEGGFIEFTHEFVVENEN